jgi:hypothetical protein
MSKDAPTFISSEIPADACVAVIAARFNAHIVDELLDGCRRRLAEEQITGDRLQIHRVPGAFELPVAAKALAQTKKFAAVIWHSARRHRNRIAHHLRRPYHQHRTTSPRPHRRLPRPRRRTRRRGRHGDDRVDEPNLKSQISNLKSQVSQISQISKYMQNSNGCGRCLNASTSFSRLYLIQ